MAIRVLLCDGQQLVRAGFHQLIEAESGMTVVGEVETAAELSREVRRLRPDVALFELDLPDGGALDAMRQIPRRDDGRLMAAPVALTTRDDEAGILAAYAAGTAGFVLKSDPVENLFTAIRSAASGRPYACTAALRCLIRHAVMYGGVSRQPATADSGLTNRERDVLQLVSSGLSNAEIAGVLAVSEGTVKSHVSRILTKLNLQNRQQAIIYAFRFGFASVQR